MEIQFEIRPLSNELSDEWNRVVRKAKNGNFIHEYEYLTYHADRFTDCSLIVFKKGVGVAVFPANRIGDEIISHGGLTYAGLIYGASLSTTNVIKIFKLLVSYFVEIGTKKIIYKAMPDVFTSYPAQEDRYALFCLGATLYRRDLSTVISFHSDIPKMSLLRQRQIKKANRAGLLFYESVDLESFHALLTDVLMSKHGVSATHSLSDLKLLQSHFPGKIRLFTVSQEDELLAGVLAFDFDHIIHTQYLAVADSGRELGALDYLIFKLLQDAASTHRYFSFGVSTEKNGRYLNEGLLFQKEGFGGRGVVHDFYEIRL